MENKKVLIPVIIASILLLGIVFTLVYKKTSEDPFKEPEVQTLAPKETKQIETKVQTENGNNIEDFNINETKELPKAVIINDNNEILDDEEAIKYEESIADSLKLEIETKEDGSEVMVDVSGNEIGVEVDAGEQAQETVSGQVMEEIQEDINDYTYKQAYEEIREFVRFHVNTQREAGNPEFMDITEEYISNATPKELDALYIKVMQTIGFER